MKETFLQSAIRGTRLVQLAYEQYDEWTANKEWTCEGLVLDINAKATEHGKVEPWGFVRHSGSSIQFVFRGTRSLTDWIADARLHEGWDFIYHQFAAEMMEIIKSIPPDYNIEIFGHSAGCAIGKRLRKIISRDCLVILYESPKDVVILNNINVINNTKDLVTHVPRLPNYIQTGTIHKFDFETFSIAGNHSIEHVLENLLKMEKSND